jgi:hypothetical protein
VWVCTCVYVYIYIWVCVLTTPEPTKTACSQVFTRKKTSFLPTIYSMFYFLEHKNRTYIYIHISIFLSIDLPIYLSIYLKIDKFNIYIHMCVHPPESTKTAFSLVFAKKKVFFQLSTPLRLSQQESLYYTWERCFCNDQANFSNPNRHPQRVHRGNRRRQTGTSSCCPKCHV